jgi:hypothetical protein
MHSRKKHGEKRAETCCGETIKKKISSLKNRRRRHPKPRPAEEVLAEIEIFFEDVGL